MLRQEVLPAWRIGEHAPTYIGTADRDEVAIVPARWRERLPDEPTFFAGRCGLVPWSRHYECRRLYSHSAVAKAHGVLLNFVRRGGAMAGRRGAHHARNAHHVRNAHRELAARRLVAASDQGALRCERRVLPALDRT